MLAVNRADLRTRSLRQVPLKASTALTAAIGAASLFAAQQASAASEIAQLAKSDNRPLIIATLFIPVVGWVGFNILGPALNQAAQMAKSKGGPAGGKGKRRGT